MSKITLQRSNMFTAVFKKMNFVPKLVILLLKLNIWGTLELNATLTNEEQALFINMIKEFQLFFRNEIEKGKLGFILNVINYFYFNFQKFTNFFKHKYYQIMLEIKDLSIESGHYFSEVFEKDILINLKSVKLT
jgi:hypothetical protein